MSQTFQKSTVREYVETIVIAVILALFVRTWIVQAFKIPTGSMENNLLIGDHLVVNKFVFGPVGSALEGAVLPVREVRRGDVVVFKYPDEPERDFIKRVIGLPGDTISAREGQVYVDGELLDEPWLAAEDEGVTRFEASSGCDVECTLGPNELFVLGDNRDNSSASNVYGPIDFERVVGRAFIRVWPIGEFGGI